MLFYYIRLKWDFANSFNLFSESFSFDFSIRYYFASCRRAFKGFLYINWTKLLSITVHNITTMIIVVFRTKPSFLAYLEVESKSSTLVKRAKGVAPLDRPLMKIMKSYCFFRLYEGLINLATNHKNNTLNTLPMIKMQITITQNT